MILPRRAPMAYWLVKSEPDDWSWDEQVAKGSKGAEWTGIRNFSAQNHLRAMKKGEQAFFYHTGKERARRDIRPRQRRARGRGSRRSGARARCGSARMRRVR